MDNQDQAVKKTELIIKALSFAQDNKLDVNNLEDVKKIIQGIDPQNQENLAPEEFQLLLKDSDTFLEMTVAEDKSQKEKMPN